MKLSSSFLSSVAVTIIVALSNNSVIDVVLGQGDAKVQCDGGKTVGESCTQIDIVCEDSATAAGAASKIKCNGSTFVAFEGTVGTGFTDAPSTTPCNGPVECSGDAKISSSKESNEDGTGDMTDVEIDGSSGSGTTTYVGTIAAATAATVCVVALL